MQRTRITKRNPKLYALIIMQIKKQNKKHENYSIHPPCINKALLFKQKESKIKEWGPKEDNLTKLRAELT